MHTKKVFGAKKRPKEKPIRIVSYDAKIDKKKREPFVEKETHLCWSNRDAKDGIVRIYTTKRGDAGKIRKRLSQAIVTESKQDGGYSFSLRVEYYRGAWMAFAKKPKGMRKIVKK